MIKRPTKVTDINTAAKYCPSVPTGTAKAPQIITLQIKSNI